MMSAALYSLRGRRASRFHLPNSLLANRADESLGVRLGEMSVVIIRQLGVDRGHRHEHANPGALTTQELFPNLERKQEGYREP